MINVFELAIAVVGGLLLGVVFYGGLWVTVSRLDTVRNPALWMLASLIVRMAVALGGLFILIRMGGWVAAMIALAAMLLVRAILKRRLEPQKVEVTS